eukprot:6214683-Pleurochrysis_carterae.AAC.1
MAPKLPHFIRQLHPIMFKLAFVLINRRLRLDSCCSRLLASLCLVWAATLAKLRVPSLLVRRHRGRRGEAWGAACASATATCARPCSKLTRESDADERARSTARLRAQVPHLRQSLRPTGAARTRG